jgi:saccharopine dehydrogenase (NADP+, L-glutamate forming)
MGFLSDEEQDFLKTPCTWKEATAKIISAQSDSEKDLTLAISSKATFNDDKQKEHLLAGLRWIGIFSDEKITPRGNPLDW